jgi:hypothetical protein
MLIATEYPRGRGIAAVSKENFTPTECVRLIDVSPFGREISPNNVWQAMAVAEAIELIRDILADGALNAAVPQGVDHDLRPKKSFIVLARHDVEVVPAFQFCHHGKLLEIVTAVNALIAEPGDHWAAARWWYSVNRGLRDSNLIKCGLPPMPRSLLKLRPNTVLEIEQPVGVVSMTASEMLLGLAHAQRIGA